MRIYSPQDSNSKKKHLLYDRINKPYIIHSNNVISNIWCGDTKQISQNRLLIVFAFETVDHTVS